MRLERYRQLMLKTVAIDGPVASGKTVVGQKLSKILDYRFLDTGTMYRAVSYIAIQDGLDYRDEDALTYLAANIGIKLELSSDGENLLWVRGKEISGGLRSREVELILPTVSKTSGVRVALVEQQRSIAAEGPIVMVGRDIGTVVLKKAPVKIFLTASIEVRARRRYIEFVKQDRSATFEDVNEQLISRDDVDSNRNDSPLMPDKDAFIINTDNIEIDDVVNQILSRVK